MIKKWWIVLLNKTIGVRLFKKDCLKKTMYTNEKLIRL